MRRDYAKVNSGERWAKEANFRGARISNVSFENGRLEGSNFENSDLNTVTITALDGACLRVRTETHEAQFRAGL